MRNLNNLLNQFQEFDIFKHSILLGYRGSIAHGTYRPNKNPNSIDDKDIMGIAVAPLEYYFGLKRFEQFSMQYKEWDVVIYDIRKYFNLMLKANPNVLSLLWMDDDKMILHQTDSGKLLIENRDIFTSLRAYDSFSGYAYSQLKKMENCACKGYMGTKRKALVEKYNYDTKNAAHLIRLLEMGIEFINTGQLQVKRKNVNELLKIKDGHYTLEQIKSKAEGLYDKMREVKKNSPLPKKPDFNKANELLIEIIQRGKKDEFN